MNIHVGYTTIAVIFIGAVIWLCFLIPSIEHPWEIVELENTKCLDGSNYKFLFHKGSINKFLVYFQGGGLCGTDGDFLTTCEERAKTELGSSNLWEFIMINVFSKYSRFFSSKESYNPLFHNWNKVILKYCDGMIHTGQVDEPITTASGYKLYFNGESNVKGTIKYIVDNYGFKTADKVVITGSSAGGMASGMWGNYIMNQLDKKNDALILNDAGFPINHKNSQGKEIFKGFIIEMMKNTKFEQYYRNSELFKSFCNEETIETSWKCYFPQYYIQNIIPPLLLMHSPYDAWMVANLATENCFYQSFSMLNNCNATETSHINAYANEFKTIVKSAQIERKLDLSLYLPNALTHTFLIFTDNWDNKAWFIDGKQKSMVNVIKEWMENPKSIFIDEDTTDLKMTKTYLKDKIWYFFYLYGKVEI